MYLFEYNDFKTSKLKNEEILFYLIIRRISNAEDK